MKRFRTILRGIICLLFLVVLVLIGGFVGVFALEKDPSDKIYLYNHAFVAERDDDGLHMWFVKDTSLSGLKTGDGVIYYSKDGYRCANYKVGEGFYCSDDLSEPAAVTNDNYVGQVVAMW